MCATVGTHVEAKRIAEQPPMMSAVLDLADDQKWLKATFRSSR
jgi:hypothetical protein